MAQDVIYPGEGSCALEKKVKFIVLGKIKSQCQPPAWPLPSSLKLVSLPPPGIEVID